MHFKTLSMLALAATSTLADDSVRGHFNINNFYAHHIPGSASSYIAFEASVVGPDVKDAPVTYCSYYGGDTANNKLASTSGDCLNPQLYWSFASADTPDGPSGNYTFAIYNHDSMNSTVSVYELGIFQFTAQDIKTYNSVPKKAKNAYAYVATPTQFTIKATKVVSQATHPPPPPRD